MKQLIITAFLIMSITITAFPQLKPTVIDKTKFNGIWIFDTKASVADSETKKRYKEQDLTIIYIEPEFKITDSRTRNGEKRYATVVFFTDGRGEITKPYAFNPNAEFESVTNWEDNNLVRKYTIPINFSGKQSGSIKYVDKYSISEDGLTLTITTETRTDANALNALLDKKTTTDEVNIIKRVYRRK